VRPPKSVVEPNWRARIMELVLALLIGVALYATRLVYVLSEIRSTVGTHGELRDDGCPIRWRPPRASRGKHRYDTSPEVAWPSIGHLRSCLGSNWREVVDDGCMPLRRSPFRRYSARITQLPDIGNSVCLDGRAAEYRWEDDNCGFIELREEIVVPFDIPKQLEPPLVPLHYVVLHPDCADTALRSNL
jgi:hypothetical protein